MEVVSDLTEKPFHSGHCELDTLGGAGGSGVGYGDHPRSLGRMPSSVPGMISAVVNLRVGEGDGLGGRGAQAPRS